MDAALRQTPATGTFQAAILSIGPAPIGPLRSADRFSRTFDGTIGGASPCSAADAAAAVMSGGELPPTGAKLVPHFSRKGSARVSPSVRLRAHTAARGAGGVFRAHAIGRCCDVCRPRRCAFRGRSRCQRCGL